MSSTRRNKGNAVNLIQFNPNTRKYELNIKPIEEILLSPKTKDCEVCILSVVGALRGGKSFLLSFFVRFLHSATVLNETENWMGDPNEKLTGFEWKKCTKRQTTGILIWSEIFYYNVNNKTKIAIILMDTQGIFDTESTLQDNITIFAFSSMISSLQIFNISKRIQEDYLNDLQLFTEYGKYALEHTRYKPFQSLMFLIRDWSNSDEYQYGEKGGLAYLNETLNTETKLHEELKKNRNHIRSCYEELKCFLLPYPINDEINDDDGYDFQGKIKDLDDEFKHTLKELTMAVLSEQNIVVKTVNGTKIKAHELLNYIRLYWRIFQNNEMPTPKSILDAASEATCINAKTAAIENYEINMGNLITEDNRHIKTHLVIASHKNYMERSVTIFDECAVLGGDDLKNSFKRRVINEIERSLQKYLNINETKAVQNEVKQLQKNVAREEANGRQYSVNFRQLESEIYELSERAKTRCGRSKLCQNFDCKFETCSCGEHHCFDHFCPGSFHSRDCVQYQTYDGCSHRKRCHICGFYHYYYGPNSRRSLTP